MLLQVGGLLLVLRGEVGHQLREIVDPCAQAVQFLDVLILIRLPLLRERGCLRPSSVDFRVRDVAEVPLGSRLLLGGKGEVAAGVQRHGRRRMLLHTLAALIAEQPDRA